MDFLSLYILFAMVAVMYFDVTRYIIPNWLVGSLLLLYPVAVLMAPQPVDWQGGLMAMAAAFAVGYAIFALRWMGGGDVKLIIACALWIGWGAALWEMVFMTALLGGALAAGLWLLRKLLPHVMSRPSWPRILREGEPVPYGIAIAATMLILLSQHKIPALG